MTHNEKKKVLERILIVPSTKKQAFWAQQFKCFNELLKLYPDNSFWIKIKFPEKFETINLLRSGYFANELKKKYLRYNYKIPKAEVIKISDTPSNKIEVKKQPKTIRDFLNS